MLDVLADRSLRLAKQLGELFLAEPDRVLHQPHVQLGASVLGLIKQKLAAAGLGCWDQVAHVRMGIWPLLTPDGFNQFATHGENRGDEADEEAEEQNAADQGTEEAEREIAAALLESREDGEGGGEAAE